MSKGKILVIDDSPIVRKLAEMALADEGYEVFTAENGEDGLRLAEEIVPSVILVDFIMPRMSGYQFCQLLRENQGLKDTPIILITAKGDDVGRKFSERFAVSDYFIKPFKSEALVDKVNAIVLGTMPEGAKYEPPAPSFDAEPAVSIPFGGFEVEPASPFAADVPAAAPEGGVAFPFAFEEPEARAEEPSTSVEQFSFEAPPSFDLPTAFDASAFGVPAEGEEAGESIALGEPVEISYPEPGEAVPTFELPSALELDSSHESPLLDDVTLAGVPDSSEPVPAFVMPSFAEALSSFEEPAEPAPTYAAPEHQDIPLATLPEPDVPAVAPIPASVTVPASAAAQPTVPVSMSRDVMQYIESSLPFIVQKSVDNILKQSGVVRDPATMLSGDLKVFDICDVLRILRSARVTGKLFALLSGMSAEFYFDAGKAVAVVVSTLSGEKKGFGEHADMGIAQMKALLVDTVADILRASEGTFSFVREALSPDMLALPLRIGPIELIQDALLQIPSAAFEACGDSGAVIVRIMHAAALGMLSLSDVDRAVLSAVDGPKQISDVIASVGGDPASVQKSIYGLLKIGVLAELG